MAIEYIKGDLFTAEPSKILLHACNCRRRWGRGVAEIFARKYPKSYLAHQAHAPELGNIQVIDIGERPIVCLFTSKGYARDTDPPAKILESTKSALSHLSDHYKGKENVEIASPMINAGLFNVPWNKTEKLIEDFLVTNTNCSWLVYLL